MQWWNEFVDWFYSDAGERVMLGAVVPFVAIVIAGVVAALIARGGIKRLLRSHDRDLKAAAVTSLVDAARQAASWNSLTPHEQALADRSASAADIQLRLLPVPGAPVAANWAGHEIRQFKRASATYSVQFDGPLAEFRDRLIDWQMHPRKSRKIFEGDLDRWRTEATREERELQEQQDAWVAQQHAQKFAPAGSASTTAPSASSGTPSSSSAPTTSNSTPASTSSPSPVAPAASASATPASSASASSASTSSTPSSASPAAASTAAASTIVPSTEKQPAAVTRPSVPLTTESRSDVDGPGSVESPTDENYAPPVSATTVRRRTEAPAPVE